MSKAADESYAANLALYEKLVARQEGMERKGATMPYTSVNGHMFSFLSKEGKMALRLPEGERENFLEMYETQQPVQYGAVMKEYVVVPDSLLRETGELKKYFELSYVYVRSLKPKPAKKRKKK